MFASLIALTLAGTQVAADPETTQEVRLPEPAWVQACEDWDEWDKPGPPFKVFGNTWYVGTCGIAAILITSENGHVLIDTGTESGSDIVLANIRAAGFDQRDIKLLLNSHEHFDHVGGMAHLQQVTGAPVVSSAIGIAVMRSGQSDPADPQHGMHEAMAPISAEMSYIVEDASSLLERFGMVPIATPGHSPGAMSWQWRSCEGQRCETIVYADSLSAVSRDGYRFSDYPEYLAQFEASLDRIGSRDCRILLTPHPSASAMREKLRARTLASGLGDSCARYAAQQRKGLHTRLAKEAAGE